MLAAHKIAAEKVGCSQECSEPLERSPESTPDSTVIPESIRSLDGRNRTVVIAESLARVIAAIRIINR